MSGVQLSDVAVIEGGFFVRAGVSASVAGRGKYGECELNASVIKRLTAAQTAKVVVNEQGYGPAKITLPAGALSQHVVRTTDKMCARKCIRR